VDPIRQIADAVLYEGYLLWPYRRSALKNQRRFTFGGVYPRGHSEAGHPDDRWQMRTECLLEGGEATRVEVRVRFLHVVRRDVARAVGDGLERVDELVVDGERHLSWEEAVEREIAVVDGAAIDGLKDGHREPIDIPAGREIEELREDDGRVAGAVIRSWRGLRGGIEVQARAARDGVHVLGVTIANTTPWDGGPRQDALERTLCSTHTVLWARGGAFVSLTDPPPRLAHAAQACRNEGTWPVLVGEPGARDTMLSSPIILEDHPRIAPESPGDPFDGGEIDGLLTLSILSLTDEEKAEMRDSDPRAREILERTESLSGDELMRLHGAIRDFRVMRP
jgi:hypothetical protein